MLQIIYAEGNRRWPQATGPSRKGARAVDYRLEVASVPVSDVDRAKDFYQRLGWRQDADFPSATASGWCR
jgi:hypothetical protein